MTGMDAFKQKLTPKKAKDIKTLTSFVEIYCKGNHRGDKIDGKLCTECDRLLKHGVAKLLLCSYDPKPKCKDCSTHCYASGYRERIKKVMKFSGIYLIKRGRLDLLAHFIKAR